ncbi:bifunctional folylpolyglutamate synthase/dihydrofolate synthase [Anthropogastromicrobium aceti]|jgi:dihydrofolate synthase/folylpolyglutamate synthase|uniref:tetrahydrofolate synthase n=1 Tax=Anthropogastromicrobium aceti TaxID=2981768 RepID=A0AAE3JC02_9FIRM|nr:folylpolyglutamate synthase/dihydrofolate synthase family protein [Anthropogastromicrobium aceti]MCC2221995.1 bifunctional folylpolyglutamate synthase/dihydrofolate synthase [Anthropogastromicrobium aceti]
MDFLEAQNYLEKVRSQKGIVLGLDTMRHLMAKLNNPQDKVKFIQVAGTNGKGSTAAYLTSILLEAGIKVGRYTSPAVFSSTEQYFACGSCISESEYAKGVTAVAEAAASLDGETPTAFEQETALAFWYFAKKGCELAILEAGLGGDMDATNIVTTTVCSIITSISMDHCRILGNKISEIAAHKAGIIKPGAPVICIEQKEDAMEPIRAAAKAADTPLYEVHRDEVRQIFSDKRESIVFFREFENLHLKMLGSCQPENAALAVQAASVLSSSYPIEKKHIYDGIEKTRWGGRFELHSGSPDIILDGAHNPDGIRRLRESVNQMFGAVPICYVCGVLADKDYEKEIEILFGRASNVFTVTPPSPRAMKSTDLKAAIKKRFSQLKVTSFDSEDGIEKAMEAAVSQNNPVVVCGTLTILARVKEWMKRNDRM